MTTASPRLRTGMRRSVDEFLDLPDDNEHRWLELDDGALYVMPRPRPIHQFQKDELVTRFEIHIDSFPETPAELYGELAVIISRESGHILMPDLSVFLRAPGDETDVSAAGNIPDFAIEVLSSNRERDLVRKRRLCAEAGVPEYWIFDPVSAAASGPATKRSGSLNTCPQSHRTL